MESEWTRFKRRISSQLAPIHQRSRASANPVRPAGSRELFVLRSDRTEGRKPRRQMRRRSSGQILAEICSQMKINCSNFSLDPLSSCACLPACRHSNPDRPTETHNRVTELQTTCRLRHATPLPGRFLSWALTLSPCQPLLKCKKHANLIHKLD